jgi:cytochrome P450
VAVEELSPNAAEQSTPSGARPPGLGWLGMLRLVLRGGAGRKDMYSGLSRMHEEFGAVVVQGGGPVRFVNLFGPDANRLVLLDRDRNFSAMRPWTRIMGRIFPGGLLLRDGEEHKHHRKIMHQAFKRPFLRDYLERMNSRIEESLARWPTGPPILAFPAFKALTLDLAAAIFVGLEPSVGLGPRARQMNQAFEDMVAASMSGIRLRIPGLEFYRGLKGREFMVDFLGKLLDQKLADRSPDLFSRLCRAETEEGDRFASRDVIDHMIFLMMAAHDTTTSALSSMSYELARHPEWQERLRDESRALAAGALALEDGDRLPGLNLVIQEVLRLYPPLPIIPRIANRSFEWQGYRIPGNSMVVISPIHTHRMTEWWSQPDRFDPERFAPERAEHERHTHSWVPFGGGSHMCIGKLFAEAQLRAVMHQMLLRFRWSVPPGYTMPVQQAPISKPRDGLPIQLEALAPARSVSRASA